MFVSIPATLGLGLLRAPITRVLFERGRFTAADTAATAEALLWFAVGLAGIAGARIAAQTFYALREPAVAVRFGVLAVAVNIVAAVTLMRPFAYAGLAASASLAAYVNLAGLVWAARRRLGPIGGTALLGSGARDGRRLGAPGSGVRRRAVALASCARDGRWTSGGSWAPSSPRRRPSSQRHGGWARPSSGQSRVPCCGGDPVDIIRRAHCVRRYPTIVSGCPCRHQSRSDALEVVALALPRRRCARAAARGSERGPTRTRLSERESRGG